MVISFKATSNPATENINKAILKGTHKGDNTQMQLQAICPVSFNPINNNVSNPKKPTPFVFLLFKFSSK